METDIGKNVSKLRSSKAAEDSNIPTKIGKHNFDFFCWKFLFYEIIRFMEACDFSSFMKMANITLVHKKDSLSEKFNCRPVNIFKPFKVFERCFQEQILE